MMIYKNIHKLIVFVSNTLLKIFEQVVMAFIFQTFDITLSLASNYLEIF